MYMNHASGSCFGGDDHAGSCALPPEFARMRYFFGQRLGVIDLSDEQGYHVGKRRFHNLYGHGFGVLCGLQAERFVAQGASPTDPTSVLLVHRGAALDGCGREIVVGVDQCVDVDSWFQQHKDDPGVQAWFDPNAPRDPILWVALRYRECPTDPAPAPRDPCGCDTQGCEYGRVREGFELALLTEDLHTGCVHDTFPAARDLDAALGAADPARALATLAGGPCPEPAYDGWLCLASLRLTFSGTPPRVTDLSAPDNAIAERATLLSTSALQALVLDLGVAAAAAGTIGAGPTLGELTFAGTGTDAGTLALEVRLFDDGSGPTPLAEGTFDPADVHVHRFDDTNGTWLAASTATVSYQASHSQIEVVFAAGDVGSGPVPADRATARGDPHRRRGHAPAAARPRREALSTGRRRRHQPAHARFGLGAAMQIDLRAYIVEKVGAWSNNPDAFSAHNLLLSNAGDGVALVGPLRLRITLQGENITSPFQGQTGFSNAAGTSLSGGTTAVVVPGVSQTHSVYSYLLDIPPLQVWSYLVREPEIIGMLGTNRGFNVVIQPGGSEVCADDYPRTPCQPDCTCGGRRGCVDPRCRCGCAQMTGGGDLPCDYAVGNIPNLGRFFPAACEPCPPDACIRVPPPPGPQGLLVRPASGGCERPATSPACSSRAKTWRRSSGSCGSSSSSTTARPATGWCGGCASTATATISWSTPAMPWTAAETT